MADAQKPVDVPAEAAPATSEPVLSASTEDTTVAPEAIETAPVADTTVTALDTTAVAAQELKKDEEEIKSVEEGHLEHKGTNFPKNLLYSKKYFWFGADPVDIKLIPSFKADKAIDAAHHAAAWAAETGKGLLFYGEKADKTTPHGAILLAEATEPVAEGTTKFNVTAKGHKHTFKASCLAERDIWVTRLKVEIKEAKELATSIKESETYKQTIESLTAAPAKKEEKTTSADAGAETVTATESSAADAGVSTTEETLADASAVHPTKEHPKRRSASRKRTSIFGSLLGGKKEEEKKAVDSSEAKTTQREATPETSAEPSAGEAAVDVTTAPESSVTVPADDLTKPIPPKRQSLFGTLSFVKKRVTSVDAEANKDTVAEGVTDTAPVISAVEASNLPATEAPAVTGKASAETTENAPAIVADTKKEIKSDKRKSSLPFAFGKKEKTASDDETEKPKSTSPFSKLRATIKGRGRAEKSDRAADKDEAPPVIDTQAAAAKAAEVSKSTDSDVVPAVPASEPVSKPLESTPAVTAAA